VYQPLVKIRIRQPGHLDPVSLGYAIAVCKAHSFKYLDMVSRSDIFILPQGRAKLGQFLTLLPIFDRLHPSESDSNNDSQSA
jgi:hypothetical protein